MIHKYDMGSFKKWLESADQQRQKDKASLALKKPEVRDSLISRYGGFLKKT
jgi:hypothetical protein